MNSSPASSCARASSSSTRSASRAVISPMRYVSMRTPTSSMAASTARQRQLDVAVERIEAALGDPRAQLRIEAERRRRAADERGRLLVGRRLRDELDAVLGGEVVEQVRRAARVDQVGHEQRVVDRLEPRRLRVVEDERGVAQPRRRARGSRARRRPPPPRARARSGRPSSASAAAPTTGSSSPSRQGTSTPETAIGAAGSASSSSSTRPSRLRNSKRRKISFSWERSGGASTSFGRVDVERQVAAHRREHLRRARLVGVLAQRLRAAPARARRRARARPRASRTARSSWPAVLSPIPGTPGMLSEVSPLSPMKSGTCSGVTP